MEFLAPALGIAASPFGVVPAILLLFTPAPRANAAAFLAGWLGGVLLCLLLAMAAAEWLSGREPGPWIAPLRVLAGGGLLVAAARQWRGRGSPEMPGWMAGLADSRPAGSARLGALLSLANPKIWLLTIAGGLFLAESPAPLKAALIFAATASLTVALPLILHLLAGDRIMGVLAHARGWLVRHNGAIVAVVMAVIGAKLLTAGLEALI
jgi:threonine/homoserine/homoserine lactone efflux protein